MIDDLLASGQHTLWLSLLLALPPVGVATLVGLVVGLLQTVTQLQEQTLAFGLKLFAVLLCLALLAGWYGEVLRSFGEQSLQLALQLR